MITCYNGNFSSCATTPYPTSLSSSSVYYPVYRKDAYTYLPGTSGPSLSETWWQYADTLGEDKEYDFGAYFPSSTNYISDRKLTFGTYSVTDGSCKGFDNRPCMDVVTDSFGAVLGKTFYQHDSHGNLLSEDHLLHDSTYATTSYTYTSAGLVQTTTDPLGLVTTYSYGQCNGSFPTGTSAAGLAQTSSWDCNGEVKVSSTDANGETVFSAYSDSAGNADPFWRVRQTSYPDGGTVRTTYNPTGTPPNTRVDTIINAIQTRTSQTSYDGLGLPLQQSEVTDPGGVTYIDTTYDARGKVASVSNPSVEAAQAVAPATKTQYLPYASTDHS